jgi:hypothetical protein
VDPCNTQEISATIARLLQSRDVLERASSFCLDTAPKKTWERVAEKILGEMFDG